MARARSVPQTDVLASSNNLYRLIDNEASLKQDFKGCDLSDTEENNKLPYILICWKLAQTIPKKYSLLKYTS